MLLSMIRKLIAPLVFLATPLAAEDLSVIDRWQEDPTQVFEASEITLDDLQWVLRPVVVFANSPLDPLFKQQLELFERDVERLAERDIILITDTNPNDPSDLRTKLRPRAFMMVLIGKDGRTKMRKPAPWDVRELSRTIDKMPLRQQEIEDRRDP